MEKKRKKLFTVMITENAVQNKTAIEKQKASDEEKEDVSNMEESAQQE